MTFDPNNGTLRFAVGDPTSGDPIWVPDPSEITDHLWRWSAWDDLPGPSIKDLQDLRAFNGHLNLRLPTNGYANGTSWTSGSVDLNVLREVYLHTSLTQFRTLTSAGLKDCLARIPIEVECGQVVTYRHIGTDSDSIPCPEATFRTLRITFRDGFGRVLDMNSYVVLEIGLIETLPTM